MIGRTITETGPKVTQVGRVERVKWASRSWLELAAYYDPEFQIGYMVRHGVIFDVMTNATKEKLAAWVDEYERELERPLDYISLSRNVLRLIIEKYTIRWNARPAYDALELLWKATTANGARSALATIKPAAVRKIIDRVNGSFLEMDEDIRDAARSARPRYEEG